MGGSGDKELFNNGFDCDLVDCGLAAFGVGGGLPPCSRFSFNRSHNFTSLCKTVWRPCTTPHWVAMMLTPVG